MPNPLTASQVIEYVQVLEHDYATFAKEEKDRLALYGLYKVPDLPEDLKRGAQVNVLSPDLMDAAHTVRPDLRPMQTEITVLPQARDEKGMIPERDKDKADTAEHAFAIILATIDHDRRLSRNVIWRQLINRLGIFVL